MPKVPKEKALPKSALTKTDSSRTVLSMNRELSWLSFNERVLLEADDPSVPLLERLTFLGIFSNNLDEFYRVRVAVLKRLANLQKTLPDTAELNYDPVKILKEIHHRTALQRYKSEEIYEDICKELAEENIFIIDETDLSEEQSVFVKQYFKETVRQFLFPIMLDRFKNFSNLHDNSIYLAVDLMHKDNPAAENLALIEIPADSLSRFVVLPVGADKRCNVLYLDDVIRHCLADIFSVYGFVRFNAYGIKFTRDAEFDISSDVSKSFLQSVSDGLKQRKFGATVRFIYDEEMPKKVLVSLRKKFGIKKRDSLEKGGRYLNVRDVMQFPRNLGAKKMQYEAVPQLPVACFPPGMSILDVIREKDVMLHYPYQPFQYIIELLREASIDPAVRAIKMTIYRAAKHSAVVNALINAARNGKEVIVFVEFQARFDEAANISWAARMQDEGIRVLPSIPGMKVHCKIILIRRREQNQNVYYAAVGTGNPNENTTRIYCDEHLLTANQDITAEVNKVFHILDDQKYQRPDFKEIIVSPFGTRKFFLKKIDREIKNAEKGKPAWMIIKLNNLVDKKLVNRLYDAGRAGVQIDLIIRGICTLVPGIPKQSENIRAVRIVDRFLEHSRIFVFAGGSCREMPSAAGNKADYYIGSADWMERNLDRRFEVMVPIHSKNIQQELWDILQIQLSDNVKARLISYGKSNERIPVTKNVKKIQSQTEIYQYLKGK
ncbi:MAG: polyphosphate kinase 1 [Planctomycetaceae bacterium]|jgi:polyphosphate kinase|nr:polyphosphate kinase 1 [Planctomycetaceae bacterium]